MTRTNVTPIPKAIGLLLLLHCIAMAPALAMADAEIQFVSGQVELGWGAPVVWRPAVAGEALAPASQLRTGADGRAELIHRGVTIRLFGHSLLRLPEVDDPASTTLGFERGAGLFDVEHRDDGSVDVHTPDVIVSVKGTRFGVDLPDHAPAEVAVYRGTVGVRSAVLADAREVLVREGFGALGGSDGPAELFLLEHADPWSTWRSDRASRATIASPPARHADGASDRAVRSRATSRALALAVERDPALAERLAAVRNDLRTRLRRAAADDGNAVSRTVASIDPILDTATGDVERLLRSQFIEEVLGTTGSTVNVALSQAGLLEIVDPDQGTVWQLDQTALVAILEGTSSLPAGLDNVLNAPGSQEQIEVATMLLGLLGQ